MYRAPVRVKITYVDMTVYSFVRLFYCNWQRHFYLASAKLRIYQVNSGTFRWQTEIAHTRSQLLYSW